MRLHALLDTAELSASHVELGQGLTGSEVRLVEEGKFEPLEAIGDVST
jgi:hypothetical protein